MALLIRNKIRTNETAVELHAFNKLDFVLQGLAVLDSDGSVFAHAFHQLSQKFAHFLVAVGGNGANIGDLLLAFDGLGTRLEVLDHTVHGEVDTAAEIHWVHTGSYTFAAFTVDGTGQNGGCGSSVTSDIVGLAGDLLDERGANIFETVRKLDGFGHSDTVLGNFRCAEGLVDHDVAAFGA